ncbi:MAG: translocation/assembly module TamB domain-containing protein [Bacteroidota bacterium]
MLRTAPVQTFLAHRAAEFLSKQLGTEVVIGNFRLNWFLDAVITDIKVLDKHHKILLQSEKIRANIKSIDFEKHSLHLNEISLETADINLVTYKGDSSMNLQFILDRFSSPTIDTTPSVPWLLQIDNIKLKESHFALRDERYMSPGKGIDFSDLDISNLNLGVKNIVFTGDSIQAYIMQLTCKEKSGFRLDDFTTNIVVCPRGLKADKLQITTAKSRLSMDLKFEYDSWNAYGYFLDSIRITANILPSQLDMRDIVSFAPDIDGMEDIFDFSGKIKGTVTSFSARDFQFAFGKSTSFKGNIIMNGLPNIEETFINLKTDAFFTNMQDLQSFSLPYSEGVNTIALPDEIRKLGNVAINGRFTGFYNDFVSKATFITDVGQVTTDILLTNNKETKNHEYNGKILVESFNVGKVFNIKQLGTLDLYATIKGKNFSLDRADLTAKGEITNLQYEGNTIGLINVDGEFRQRRFTGGIYINDELLKLDFVGSADFSKDFPAFDFQADVTNANLAKLNLVTTDSIVMLSTSTDFKFTGNTIDNLIGGLHFSNTSFTLGDKTLKMNDLSVVTTSLDNGGKRMEVKSDFADAVFTGQYTFDDMAEYLTVAFTEFLPSLASREKQPLRLNRGSFDYTIQLKHTDSLTQMFVPWLKINPKTVISGTFDPALGKIDVTGRSPMIVLNGFALHDWKLTGATVDKSLKVLMECNEINLSESAKSDSTIKRIEQFKLTAIAADDSVKFGISWDDFKTADHNKGMVKGAISFKQTPRLAIRFDDAEIVINDTLWKSIPGNLAIIDTSYIEIRKIGFTNQENHIFLNGIVSHDPLSQMTLDVKGFNISQTDVLTAQIGIDLDGYLSGKIRVSELYAIPRVSADLQIAGLGFNHESLGDAEIKSTWDSEHKLIGIDMRVVYVGNAGTHYPIKVVGNIYPERKHENFDLKVDVDNLKLRTIETFLAGTLSRIRGYASGAVTMTGDFSDPVLKGKLNLMRSELLVDYLRTSYSFTGDFNFDKDLMWFKDIELTDSTMSKGLATGYLHHVAFSDWALDITVKADKLSALNTSYNSDEVFYGHAKATGTLTIKGPVEDLVITADMRSDKGTSVFIPISFARGISENDFIQYRKHDTIEVDKVQPPEESSLLALQLGLDVTRNANIGIILPYQMGTIDVRGDGLINMGIDSRGEYSMYGNYIMDNGDFMFNFENILKKNFQIQKGGSITFNGSPFESDINLQAVYKVKTTLAGLPEIAGMPKTTRLNVNCLISLSNNLYNPDIKFGIELPDASDEVKRAVFSIIDTSNALEMNQQMISLLVLNTFSSSSGISSASASLGISSYEIISAQLSKMLSQISKDFDIGVNYRPGDQLSPQELELALSTQLFDNRVTINGAVGQTTNLANQSSQFIGDVQVEVAITEDGRFKARAFNRTNTTLDYSTGYSPYTQGVGIVFRKEFNTIKELFTRKKPIKVPDAKPDLKN